MKTVKKFKINTNWENAGSAAAILFFLVLMYRALQYLLLTGHPSGIFLLIFEGLVIYLFLTRTTPKDISVSPYDWFVALAGTVMSLQFIPEGGMDTRFLHGVQMAGMLLSILGIVSLNKSFGIVAANRGVKTEGLYRYIRHPIYAGYFISFFAFFLQNASVYNAVVLMLSVLFLVLRIFAEEKFLSKDPKYQKYTERVRWRVCPWIF